MKKIVAERKDIAFYIKLYPLPMHKDAREESIAIMCGENPLALLDDAFEKKELPKPKLECNQSLIDENIKLGQKLGISGTPAMILSNGTLIPGYRDAAAILKLIDSK